MASYAECRRLESQLEFKNDELDDVEMELGFCKSAEAKAVKRYKRALDYNAEVEAEVAELKSRFDQEKGQLLRRLIHFKDKLAERELELRNFKGKMTAGCRELEADLASKRHVNDVKCSSKTRKRKEFAKPTVLSERKLVGENGVACDKKRKSAAYIQKSENTDFSSDDSNHSDDSSSDVGDHKQDTEQTKIQIFLKYPTGRTITVRVEPSLIIHGLKCKIEDKVGIPIHDYRLVLDGKQLRDDLTLADYNIQNECIIYLIPKLPWGMKI